MSYEKIQKLAFQLSEEDPYSAYELDDIASELFQSKLANALEGAAEVVATHPAAFSKLVSLWERTPEGAKSTGRDLAIAGATALVSHYWNKHHAESPEALADKLKREYLAQKEFDKWKKSPSDVKQYSKRWKPETIRKFKEMVRRRKIREQNNRLHKGYSKLRK